MPYDYVNGKKMKIGEYGHDSSNSIRERNMKRISKTKGTSHKMTKKMGNPY